MEILKRYKRTMTYDRLVGIKCDVCGNEIEPTVGVCGKKQVRFAECSLSHDEWANDLCGSIEYFDVCPDCLSRWVGVAMEYLEEHGNSGSASIDMYLKTIEDDKEK